MSYYDVRGKVYTLKLNIEGRWWHGYDAIPEFTIQILPKGSKVKVVMCSRFGDVGITPDLTTEHGYIARVDPSDLE